MNKTSIIQKNNLSFDQSHFFRNSKHSRIVSPDIPSFSNSIEQVRVLEPHFLKVKGKKNFLPRQSSKRDGEVIKSNTKDQLKGPRVQNKTVMGN